jgi:hypothetical protein
MPRIRDLGINFIPATMRPPEMGPGGFGTAQCGGNTEHTCNECTDLTDKQCVPHSNCGANSRGQQAQAGGLTAEGIDQLKRQLRSAL